MVKSLANRQLLTKEGTVLIIIDVQEKLFSHMAEKEQVAENVAKLIRFAEIMKMPLILTEQYPKGLGRTIPVIRQLLPRKQPIEKIEFSCFESEKFKEALAKLQARTLIIAGIEAHICVVQTAIEGLCSGYNVCVVEDAVSSRKLSDKATAIERMRQSGVTIVSTEMLMYELLKKAGTPEFKETLKLIK